MGRHWQNIKLGKGKADSARSAKFTILGRAITMAAKEKGGDPSMNNKLRVAIDKAKESFMPKDNIERAIKRGTGELESAVIEEIVYEGYGPGGAAVLIDTLTDNRNRTVGNVKNAFSKNGGTFGSSNSVAWMFERKGVIRLSLEPLEGRDLDEIELQMVDFGADDVIRNESELEIRTSVLGLIQVREAIEKAGYKIAEADLEYLAKDTTPYDAEKHAGLTDLLEFLEADEDVKAVYTNVQF
jgi:YebC/PmpR family DNA-binding regulatory protein